MSLIVEDGSGKSDAESYCDVAYADTYHSNRLNTAWAALDTSTKEANLRLGTEFLVGLFRTRWKGRRRLLTQALDWPRVGVVIEDVVGDYFTNYGLFQVDYTIVPVEVKKATAEMALRAISGPLVADVPQQAKKETVGPVSVEWDTNATPNTTYVQIERLLTAYLESAGVMVKLRRV